MFVWIYIMFYIRTSPKPFLCCAPNATLPQVANPVIPLAEVQGS